MNKMIQKKKGKALFFLFPHLSRYRTLTHAISTRKGGVSGNCFASFNLSFQVGDDYPHVLKNHQILSYYLGFDLHSLVTAHQVHQDRIALIDSSYLKKSCFLPERAIPDTDALITDVPGITLMTRHADCTPLIFYDPHSRVVAIAHAGWRGTLARLGRKTVEALITEYHCNPHHLRVGIGPSIGPCCYHVPSSLADQILKTIPRAHKSLRESSDGTLLFDLWQANRQELLETGIREEHLVCAQLCTSCNIELFFSHRKEQGKTGRFGALIGLAE